MPPNVEVRRSARRRRTVSAYRDGDKTVVLVPSRLSKAEEEQWVAARQKRSPRGRAQLQTLIDDTVLREAVPGRADNR